MGSRIPVIHPMAAGQIAPAMHVWSVALVRLACFRLAVPVLRHGLLKPFSVTNTMQFGIGRFRGFDRTSRSLTHCGNLNLKGSTIHTTVKFLLPLALNSLFAN
jgi:hypothetical protein